MKRSKPPFIAALLLDRLGAAPQIDAIAGDLLEQYQAGRSRLWYWREVITAIAIGTWSAVKDYRLLMLRALAIGWVVTYVTMGIVAPLEVSILSRFVVSISHAFYELPLVMGLMLGGPWCVLTGWLVARFSHRCRIPAVLGFGASFLVFGLVGNTILMIVQDGDPLLPWTWLPGNSLLTILILFGGGLLTGSPKRSVPTLP